MLVPVLYSSPTTCERSSCQTAHRTGQTSSVNALANSFVFPCLNLCVISLKSSPTHLPFVFSPSSLNISDNAATNFTPSSHRCPTRIPLIVSCCVSLMTSSPNISTVFSSVMIPVFNAAVPSKLSGPQSVVDEIKRPMIPRMAVSSGSEANAAKYEV